MSLDLVAAETMARLREECPKLRFIILVAEPESGHLSLTVDLRVSLEQARGWLRTAAVAPVMTDPQVVAAFRANMESRSR